ncbi:hypothetical protein BRM9_1171 [Methanobacterium formicicum]|uniref:DUF5591 domain-containing protein n=1 Tax=Methanobacterium formicicum TaxID=2162 RepID=A0A089ZDB1_METFO|nr:DUF5591 domain-containing protein [Methanobacterium formicicum]AIS31987.1 hypothetical protein BRM9_1171 [Methanobacterium formicicum]
MEHPNFSNKDYIGLNGTKSSQLLHPHFQEWQNWFINSYNHPKSKIALFIPCAAIKPYYNSPIHKIINQNVEKFENKIHKIVISNAGVIPYEFCDKYPFDSYDWNPVTESKTIQKEYYEVTRDRIALYLKKHAYESYVSYLRPSSLSFEALKDSCNDLNIKIYYKNLNEIIENDKDTDLVLTYPENLKLLQKMLEDAL